MTYRLPPANWENAPESQFGVGETLLEAISNGRIFNIEPCGVGFKITEQCDDCFSLFLTAPQLYQLGTELRELIKIQLASEEATTMSNLSPAAQAVLDAFNREARPEPHHQREAIAAALRAAAEQCQIEWNYHPDYPETEWVVVASDLTAIADELEGQGQLTKKSD